MIAIVSSSARERAALAALCASRGWLAAECESVRALARFLRRNAPSVLLVRHKLADGYSDDAMAALAAAGLAATTKVVVLAGADTAPAAEARQVSLGADCVQRDPVRIGVLAEYLAKYRAAFRRPSEAGSATVGPVLRFAGGDLHRIERTLTLHGKRVALTPREIELVEMLVEAKDVVTYDMLYSEILGRRFAGETSNMRVLLGKLGKTTAKVGLDVRQWIEVIPKLGYRYRSGASGDASAPGGR